MLQSHSISRTMCPTPLFTIFSALHYLQHISHRLLIKCLLSSCLQQIFQTLSENTENLHLKLISHLEYLIPGQQPPVPCNDPVSVNFLNHDVDERRLISTNNADSQLYIWVCTVDLYGSYLSFRKGGELHTA